MHDKLKIAVLVVLSLIALAGCSGGGGGGGGSGAAPPPAGSSNWDALVWDQDNWG